MPSFAVFTIVFAFVAAAFITLAPRRDRRGLFVPGILLLVASVLVSALAEDLRLDALGWWLGVVPFALGWFGEDKARKTTVAVLGVSALLMTVTAFIPAGSPFAVFGLVVAVWLRAGFFPAQGWIAGAFERGPLLPMALLVMGQGAAVMVTHREMASWFSVAAMITALIVSLRNFAEHKPRRMLANVAISHSAFVIAGLTSHTEEGLVGACTHALVFSIAMGGLCGVLRILEVRVMDVTNPEGKLGLAVKAPRLAAVFLVCGLALFGLPGTLGYISEDLLFQGALGSHPWLGMCLLIATAFNAINLLRLYGILFLGVVPKNVIDIPDALARERWPLVVCVVALIAGGLMPQPVLRLVCPAKAKETTTHH
jgi:NADH-quinone oxidoreductase subunit M